MALGSSHLIKLLKTTTKMHRHSFGKQPDKSTKSKCKNSYSRLAGFKTWLYNAPATAAAAWAGTGQALAGRGRSLALLFFFFTAVPLLFETVTAQMSIRDDAPDLILIIRSLPPVAPSLQSLLREMRC